MNQSMLIGEKILAILIWNCFHYYRSRHDTPAVLKNMLNLLRDILQLEF
jgi:hypothetical protein